MTIFVALSKYFARMNIFAKSFSAVVENYFCTEIVQTAAGY
jgi:hypothetical protein